jgi:enterochelin esterase-like enzyme
MSPGDSSYVIHKIREQESPILKRIVDVDVIVPHNYQQLERLPMLVLNDGQDSKAVRVKESIQELHKRKLIQPLIVVGVRAGDRLKEYGVSKNPDYLKRGTYADRYARFIITELIPYINDHYPVDIKHAKNTIAGYSLGGLSALDIIWNHRSPFKQVGVFSGSLWWRRVSYEDGYTDDDRIIHQAIKNGHYKKGLRFWFQTGLLDERADRNNNGIIDSVDDTLDLIAELIKKGYRPYRDISYYEMKRGRHNPDTWRIAMPRFLRWAFGNDL